MNTTLQTLQSMRVGQRWMQKFQSGAAVFVRRPDAQTYELRACWPVNAILDEDPESVLCACPLQGRSHVEARKSYAAQDLASLVHDYEAAMEDVAARRIVRFADATRVGA